MRATCALWAAALLLAACSQQRATAVRHAPEPALLGQAPAVLAGVFDDDYGELHTVSDRMWVQHPRNRFHILRWNRTGQYLIAANDTGNGRPQGRFTRIDWIELAGMPPYQWAFCFSSYDAASAAAAESVHVARPDTPRTGCNGHPFTRMKRRM